MGAAREELVKDGKILDSGEMGVIASDAVDEHVSSAEIVSGGTENRASMTNVESLEGGVTIIDGRAAIGEGIVFDNTNAEQVIYENYQDYQVNELVSEETEFNHGESLKETGAEIQLTGCVVTEIIERGNEMYFGPSDVSMKALEGRLPLSDKKTVIDVAHADPNTMHMEVDDASVPSDAGLHIGNAMDVAEQDDGAEVLEMADKEEEIGEELQTDSYMEVDRAVYQLPPDEENVFAVSDLVWGKVRSHPWWPGQIFDPSDASEKAMEYHDKDSFLVAYFGDNTFAWNEASLLKPFQSCFPSAVRQSNAEEFQNAVDCALEEVSRRVELGLACSCLSKDVVDEIKVQIIENVGIRPDSCTVKGVGKFADANSFKPYEFIQYLKALAQSPSSGADRLELIIAKAQLLALYWHKGFNQLPEFQSFGDLIEDTAEALDTKDGIQVSDIKDGMATSAPVSADVPRSSSHRRKHNLKDIVYHRRKEISLFELMDEAMIYSEDDEFELDGTLLSKRHRGFDADVDSGSMTKGVSTIPSLPKPSFKIGACISRVASQMTRSPSLKFQSEGVEPVEGTADISDAERGKSSVAPECQSLPDLVSQLQSVAINPKGGHSSFSVTASFFTNFRNSVAGGLDLSVGSVVGKRRKSSQYAGGSSEAFEFEDMNDSYWTDRTVGNGFEDNLDGFVNGGNHISFEHEKPRKAGRRPYTRRRDVEVSKPLPEKPAGYVDPNSPAELVMTFPEPRFIPSEVSLNRTFKCFGPLNVLQTELDRDGNRARVVFKRSSDAEIACSSASKFNIFGSLVVNYQLNYTLSDPFTTYYKPVPLPEASTEAPEDAS
ncbi:hypothetical protein MLD38_008672 [Melastoma candidum]|nr:hypothetical protein MLD38_008672 [Melastoma candidum]